MTAAFLAALGSAPLPDGRRRGTVQDLVDAGLVPGLPAKHVLPWTWVPRAPLLPDEPDPARDADLLWRAWETESRRRGAWRGAGGAWRREARRGERRLALEQLTSVPEAQLRLCAEAMREHAVEPVAWVAWSWDVWVRARGPGPRGGKPRPPPPRWVFSATRVVERAGWFRAETPQYRGPLRHAPWPPATARLWADLQSLWRAAEGLHPEDDADAARALVAERWPRGYAAALAEAEAEHREQQAAIRTERDAGGNLWAS